MAKTEKTSHAAKSARKPATASRVQSLAIVSGKGGSGKTMVTVAIAQALTLTGKKVLLVDADLGTGGLSYYLGFSEFAHSRAGLTEFIMDPNGRSDLSTLLVGRRGDENEGRYSREDRLKLLPVGEHRIADDLDNESFSAGIGRLIGLLGEGEHAFDYAIFDCRGGIDKQSLAVCKNVKSVVMVVETDAASIQASQHLVDVMSKAGTAEKIEGFILNKVMDDPSVLAKAGTSFFRTRFLGAVPFDLEATRDFIKGKIPAWHSLFSRHVVSAIMKIDREMSKAFGHVPLLQDKDFATVTLKEPELTLGAIIFMGITIICGLIITASLFVPNVHFEPYQGLTLVYALLASSLLSFSDTVKRAVGRAIRTFNRIFELVLERFVGW